MIQEGASPYQVLMLLPNADLLAAGTGPGVSWWVLSPGAGRWRVVSRLGAPEIWGRLLV